MRRIEGSVKRRQARDYYRRHRDEILAKKSKAYHADPKHFMDANKRWKARYPVRARSVQRRSDIKAGRLTV